MLLSEALRCDHLLLRRDVDGVEKDVFEIDVPVIGDHSDGIVDVVGIEGVPFLEETVEAGQDSFGEPNVDLVALDDEIVALGVNLYANRFPDSPQISAMGAEEGIGQLEVVKSDLLFESCTLTYWKRVFSRFRNPLEINYITLTYRFQCLF